MHVVDHLFILFVAIAYPVYCTVSYRNDVQDIKAGNSLDPIKMYRETMIHQWIGLAALAAGWIALSRPAADLGFGAPGGRGFFVSVVVLAIACCGLVISWQSVKRMTREQKAEQVEALGDLAHFLPHNRKELRTFICLSVTAGIVEEIVYRGFVIWYLSHIMPLWGSVIISSLIFGFGHGYQGVTGITKTALVGLGFAVIYVLSGSLWVPMVGHMLFDILQGKMVTELFSDEGE